MRIFDNLLYKLSALIIAFVLWATVQGFQSEARSLDIPVEHLNVPEDLVVVHRSQACH